MLVIHNSLAIERHITEVILVFQTNKMMAMLVYEENTVGVELFSYVNAFFCSSKLALMLAMKGKTTY